MDVVLCLDFIEKMFEQCDIQIWCESDDGESILHYENRHIHINIDNPFENDHTKDFRELLGSQNTILDTENTNIEEECIVEQNSKIVSEIKKQEKKKKSKKFKINMKKAGFVMILLFCIVLVFFGLSIKEIQKEKVTTQGTTQTATEEVTTETATTQEKKASTERKTEKKTESSTQKTTTDRRNITISTRKKVGTTKKRNTTAKKKKTVKKVRKTVKTTQKKRTTTAKKRVTMQQPKTTTENSKNHTKEEFNVDYKVE